MALPIRKVGAAGWLASGDSMGTLVNEGIMTKEYDYTYRNTVDIVWTLHEDAGVIIDNGVDAPIHPGQSVKWEK
jgi:hypothetical protein